MEEVRVRCLECKSKFKGSSDQIAKLPSCPKCGASVASFVIMEPPQPTIPLREPEQAIRPNLSNGSHAHPVEKPTPPPGYFYWGDHLIRLTKHQRANSSIGVFPSIWSRFWAALIDFFVGYVLVLILTMVLFSTKRSGFSEGAQGVVWLIYLAYMAFGDSAAFGGTLGKKALGLKVVDSKGHPISGWAGIGRSLLKFIGHPYMWGLLVAYSNNERQGLHDMAVRSFVVESKFAIDADSLPFLKSHKLHGDQG